jgi:hypothetical protein
MVQRKSVVIASVLAVAGLAALGCEEKKPAPAPSNGGKAPANKAPATPPPAATGTTGTTGATSATGGH